VLLGSALQGVLKVCGQRRKPAECSERLPGRAANRVIWSDLVCASEVVLPRLLRRSVAPRRCAYCQFVEFGESMLRCACSAAAAYSDFGTCRAPRRGQCCISGAPRTRPSPDQYINISESVLHLAQREGRGTHPIPPLPSTLVRDIWVVHLTTPFDPIFFETFFPKRQTS